MLRFSSCDPPVHKEPVNKNINELDESSARDQRLAASRLVVAAGKSAARLFSFSSEASRFALAPTRFQTSAKTDRKVLKV